MFFFLSSVGGYKIAMLVKKYVKYYRKRGRHNLRDEKGRYRKKTPKDDPVSTYDVVTETIIKYIVINPDNKTYKEVRMSDFKNLTKEKNE